jgi:hypothetical protein
VLLCSRRQRSAVGRTPEPVKKITWERSQMGSYGSEDMDCGILNFRLYKKFCCLEGGGAYTKKEGREKVSKVISKYVTVKKKG